MGMKQSVKKDKFHTYEALSLFHTYDHTYETDTFVSYEDSYLEFLYFQYVKNIALYYDLWYEFIIFRTTVYEA